ncbi:hypothetical protein ACLOJK_018705 [Asimina triloba]
MLRQSVTNRWEPRKSEHRIGHPDHDRKQRGHQLMAAKTPGVQQATSGDVSPAASFQISDDTRRTPHQRLDSAMPGQRLDWSAAPT